MKGPPPRPEPKEQFPPVEGIILDAADVKAGDRVVYPNQGVCRITGIERKEIAGQRLELVRMEREEDGAAVLVPKAKVSTIGLRRVATGEQMEGVFHYLAAQYDDPELDWKIRHRDNADRLIAGGVLGVAEVVKGLHALSRIRPLPTKEREQYDNSRHLLVHEVAVSLGVPPCLAEDYIDYALMPPAGVTFKLKPPPKPVELPVRPRRKVVRTDNEAEDDLGLDELGIVLPDAEAPGAALPDLPAVPGLGDDLPGVDEEGGVPAIPSAEEIPAPELEGGADDEDDEGDEEEAEAAKPAARAKAPAPAAKKAPASAPAKAGKAAAPAPAKKAPAPAAPKKPMAQGSKKPAGGKAAKPAAAKGAASKTAAAKKGAPSKPSKPAPKPKPAAKKAPPKPAAKKPAAKGKKK